MEYVDCKSCPRTCQSNEDENLCVTSFMCEPGCQCPSNKVLHEGKCIEPSDCPCKDSNGIVHEVWCCFKNAFLNKIPKKYQVIDLIFLSYFIICRFI